jgi:hypothetical protein
MQTSHEVYEERCRDRLDRNCALLSAMSLAAMGDASQLIALLPKPKEPRQWSNPEASKARETQRAMRRQY